MYFIWSQTKKWNVICRELDETGDHCVMWNKPTVGKQIQYNVTYVDPKELKSRIPREKKGGMVFRETLIVISEL